MQYEPCVRAAFPDPAVRNDVVAPVQAGVAVKLLELVIGSERSVIVGRLAPGHVDRGRNVTTTLCLLLRQMSRREEPACVLVRAANIDQALGADCGDHLVAER